MDRHLAPTTTDAYDAMDNHNKVRKQYKVRKEYCSNGSTAPTALLLQRQYCSNGSTAPTAPLLQRLYCSNGLASMRLRPTAPPPYLYVSGNITESCPRLLTLHSVKECSYADVC